MDLTKVFTKGDTIPDRKLFWNSKAMRDGDWKLMLGGKGAPKNSVGLYNLADDIGEQTNLAGKYPERVAAMRRAIEIWETDVTRDATPQRETPLESL